MFRSIVIAGSLLVILAGPVLAQEPGGEEEEFDVEKAMKEVARLLKESEELLAKTLKPKSEGSAEGLAQAGEKAREAIDKLLRSSQQKGEDAKEKMNEILRKAPQCNGGGGGGSQQQQQPSPEEDEMRRQQEQKLDERDPLNSEDDPKSGQKNESEPKTANKKPPESETDDPSKPDPNQEWLGRLPERIRLAYLNGEWSQIPERWRKLIEAYTKRMADIESDR